MNTTLLVLAAGRGSRFGGAKQVFPLGPNGETIMEYSIYDALSNGFDNVVLVINKTVEMDTFDLINKMTDVKDKISYAYQDLSVDMVPKELQANREKPWGTAHAILSAKDKINGAFAMINADDFYGKDAFATMAKFLKENNNPSDFSMVGYELENTLSLNGTVSRGISISDSNGLLNTITETHGIYQKDEKIFAEHPEGGEMQVTEGLASMNFWGFQNNLFDELDTEFQKFLKATPNPEKDEYQIPTVIDGMIKKGMITVTVLQSSAKWFGVTYKEDKDFAKESISKYVNDGLYPSPLWK